MEAVLTNPFATLIVGMMMGVGGLILFIKRLDREAQNGIFYAGMLVIVLLVGGTLLAKLLGG